MDTVITSQEFILALGRALNMDVSHVNRIIIEAVFGDVVHIHINQFGDKRLLAVDWNTQLKMESKTD